MAQANIKKVVGQLASDEKSDLSVTMDFDGECWDVWFPHPLGGRQVLGSFATEGEAEAFADDQRHSTER